MVVRSNARRMQSALKGGVQEGAAEEGAARGTDAGGERFQRFDACGRRASLSDRLLLLPSFVSSHHQQLSSSSIHPIDARAELHSCTLKLLAKFTCQPSLLPSQLSQPLARSPPRPPRRSHSAALGCVSSLAPSTCSASPSVLQQRALGLHGGSKHGSASSPDAAPGVGAPRRWRHGLSRSRCCDRCLVVECICGRGRFSLRPLVAVAGVSS